MASQRPKTHSPAPSTDFILWDLWISLDLYLRKNLHDKNYLENVSPAGFEGLLISNYKNRGLSSTGILFLHARRYDDRLFVSFSFSSRGIEFYGQDIVPDSGTLPCGIRSCPSKNPVCTQNLILS